MSSLRPQSLTHPPRTPADGIIGPIESFFGAAGDEDTTGQLLNGFKALCPLLKIRTVNKYLNLESQKTVTTPLNVFVGNALAGQKDESKYFVYMHHNAIVRVDVKVRIFNTRIIT